MAGWLPKKKCWPRTCLLLLIDSYYSSVTAQHIGDCLYVYVICWPLPFCHATQNPKRSNTNGKWTVFNYNVGKYFGMSSVCVCVCSYNWIRALANRADQVTERPTHRTRHRHFIICVILICRLHHIGKYAPSVSMWTWENWLRFDWHWYLCVWIVFLLVLFSMCFSFHTIRKTFDHNMPFATTQNAHRTLTV